jgi:hypothetical protein
LVFSDKRHNPAAGAALTFLRGCEDRLDVETVLGGLVLADTPDFLDYRVS